MIDILNDFLKMVNQFINGIYNFQIDLTDNATIKIGDLAMMFLTVICVIYFTFSIIRKKTGGDE